MKVQPNPSGQTPRPALDRSGRVAPRPADRHSPPAPGLSFDAPARDNVELSDEARALQQQAEVGAPESSIEPARLRQVLDRMASGWYDRDEVRADVVEKIRREL